MCERVNAVIGSYGAVTQYMHPTNREGRIERITLLYTVKLDANMPFVLLTMYMRARNDMHVSRRDLQDKLLQLQQEIARQNPGFSEAQVRGSPFLHVLFVILLTVLLCLRYFSPITCFTVETVLKSLQKLMG